MQPVCGVSDSGTLGRQFDVARPAAKRQDSLTFGKGQRTGDLNVSTPQSFILFHCTSICQNFDILLQLIITRINLKNL